MIAKEVAQGLLDTKAVTLSVKEPYTWASGLKSPIYCDNRITLSYPKVRSLIAQGLKDLILKEFKDVEAIVGVATGGLPQAALVADLLELPLAYVRPQAKDHGKTRLVEGFIKEGSKVVMIEDLISTGGSVLRAVDAVKNEGYDVLGVAAVFSYELQKAVDNFKGVRLHTLSSYPVLIEQALTSNYITEADLESLKSWRENPEEYGK
ncbi:MAG: orotate phosphoribosyltransferase [Erysipelothrix sp.]|nr:orotate phosphoribosyltransferase [Erysipelothrix sp.]